MLTAWDGYARLDFSSDRLRVTLLTMEHTVFRRLHDRLACAFVPEDDEGPPAFVELVLDAGLTDDTRVLLGERLAAVAESVVGRGRGSDAARLDLTEVEAYADTWAPYREQVLTAPDRPRGSVGTWARELWTSITSPELGVVVGSLATAGVHFRSSETIEWHPLVLPDELAEAGGIETALAWAAYDDSGDRGVVVRAHAAGEVRLLAGFDDGRDAWVPFGPGREPGVVLADLPVTGTHRGALRFRTEER